MAESAGRRIKRSILISTTSIRFLESDELEQLYQIERISSYLTELTIEINQDNQMLNSDKSLAINGRNLTNLGFTDNMLRISKNTSQNQ